jgi:hypothetical protein
LRDGDCLRSQVVQVLVANGTAEGWVDQKLPSLTYTDRGLRDGVVAKNAAIGGHG